MRKAPSHQKRARPIPHATHPSSLAKTIRESLENPRFSDEEKEHFIDKLLFSYLMPVELMLSPELTQREQECFRLAELNLNSTEIGERLGIKKTTVISRLKAAKRKLGCSSLLEAICQAVKRRYLKGTIENPGHPPHG